MSSFLKELRQFYRVRRRAAARAREDTSRWLEEEQKALEVAVVDRHLRLGAAQKSIRQRMEGRSASAAAHLVRVDRIKASLYENLLRLGEFYLERTEAETRDRKRMGAWAEQAFSSLAMVYRHTRSPESLAGIRRVNEIQRAHLHELARISWKRAQLAVHRGDVQAAAEHYYQATVYFNEAVAKSVGVDKREMSREFLRLKKELAAWHAARDSAAATGPSVR